MFYLPLPTKHNIQYRPIISPSPLPRDWSIRGHYEDTLQNFEKKKNLNTREVLVKILAKLSKEL